MQLVSISVPVHTLQPLPPAINTYRASQVQSANMPATTSVRVLDLGHCDVTLPTFSINGCCFCSLTQCTLYRIFYFKTNQLCWIIYKGGERELVTICMYSLQLIHWIQREHSDMWFTTDLPSVLGKHRFGYFWATKMAGIPLPVQWDFFSLLR